MPTAPSTLATDVARAIASMIESNEWSWPRDTSLADDLGLTEIQRKGLAKPFTAIAREYGKRDPSVSRQATGRLSTVQEAIDLVARAAGFEVPTP